MTSENLPPTLKASLPAISTGDKGSAKAVSPPAVAVVAPASVKAIDPAEMGSLALLVKNLDEHPDIFEKLSPDMQDLVIDIVGREPDGWDRSTRSFVSELKIGPKGNKKTVDEWRKLIRSAVKKKKSQLLKI